MADPYYRLRARIRERSIEMVRYAADALAHDIDQTTPVKSGKLKESQRVRISAPSSDDRVSVSISYDVPYARSTDLGWEGGQIVPKERDFLQFFWDKGPRGPRIYRFLEIAQHPGWPGSRWYSQWIEPDIWQTQLQRAERDLTK